MLTKQKYGLLTHMFKQIKEILLFFLPKGKMEFLIFCVFFLFYISYSLIVAFKTSIIDSDILVDVYFSFDNPQYYRQGFSYVEAHPLIRHIMYPLLYVGNLLKDIFGYKIKALFFAVNFVLLSSLSCAYIYRYFVKIVGLDKIAAIIMTCFFGFMSTNLILCFTPESFSLTSFALVAMVLFYSERIKQERSVPFIANLCFPLFIGGITFTNFVKGLIPMIFVKEKFKVTFIKMGVVTFVFCLILFLTPGFLGGIYNMYGMFGHHPSYEYFDDMYLIQIVDSFWGAPIFFPRIFVEKDFVFELLVDKICLDFYHHFWQYIFVGVLFILVLFSIFKGFKNKYVVMVCLLLGVDVAIHIILKYGFKELHIYGGHWVYCVPILLGWLFKYVSGRQYKALLIVMTIMLFALCANNVYELINFLNLAIEYHPA